MVGFGDRWLVVWERRLLFEGGAFGDPEFLVADATRMQMLPAAAFDGTSFTFARNDYRGIEGVEQLRADGYAARVAPDGTVLDAAAASRSPVRLFDGCRARGAGANGPRVRHDAASAL